jgi:hypothetical protein
MRFRDKNGPLHHPILKPANLPDFLTVARTSRRPSVCAPTVRTQEVPTATGTIAQTSESRQVWVNTATGIYHYRGARWYGKTKQGKYMSEAHAKASGYRASRNGQ